jgi:alpha-N-arabinofuranosidase
MRDGVLAGMTLNIFNARCDRVRMANLAQTVNVLQAVVLTDEKRMIVTPTYHVMEMYAVHHDGVSPGCQPEYIRKRPVPALLSPRTERD